MPSAKALLKIPDKMPETALIALKGKSALVILGALSHNIQDPQILERGHDESRSQKEPENHHLRLARQEKYHVDGTRQHGEERG